MSRINENGGNDKRGVTRTKILNRVHDNCKRSHERAFCSVAIYYHEKLKLMAEVMQTFVELRIA